jgi:hypothetical protein
MSGLLTRDYPPATQGYDTLTLPSAIIPYCFPPNCPTASSSSGLYEPWYTRQQQEQYNIGLERYIQSRQPQRDYDTSVVSPVFNSNMSPLATNYMRYDTINK